MGPGVSGGALIVGFAAFASETLSQFSMPRHAGWVNVLGGLGLLALAFAIFSPAEDGFQQEWIRPATSSVRMSSHTRVAPRRSLANLSAHAFLGAGDSTRILMTGRSLVGDRSLELDTSSRTPISIHSPPAASATALARFQA
jgi:hypothetical protein